ncbi:MAG TPA: penicillin-binding protein 1C, partial [Gemmatimonadaceae bacterium]|nr:penicillin-binding protein 1C [Gemmatimonadaceae bacterium]
MRRWLLRALGVAAAASVAVAAWVAWPLPEGLVEPAVAPQLVVTDRQGVPLRGTRAGDGTRARWIALGDIDPDLITAFIAVEDRRFYEHHGVDWRAVGRAARDGFRARRVVSGASTLTMQTARLLVGNDRDWLGKISQALWALRLERHLSKQEILEQYLNRVHLGEGTVGVAAATALYFDASPREVSPGQAALLAAIAHSPATDNPFQSVRRATRGRAAALRRMRSAGFLDEAQAAAALDEPVRQSSSRNPFLAPHFTTRVLQWADDSALATPRALGGDGVLRTSLDLALQESLESEVRHTVSMLADRGVRQAAAVVLDNPTGEVLAWVGSPDFWEGAEGQTDMVISARQPGSALKPFVYGLAFDRGYTPATVLADVARSYTTSIGIYRPRNYDHRYHGPVRVREALGSSYNVPAVAMAEELGVASVLGTLRDAGFASLRQSADHYGLGLALGNGDVSLLEMANAYRALANRGEWHPARWRSAGDGPAREGARRVMSPRSAALVLDILADPEARVPGFGLATPFDFAFPVAVKTGTSRHFTDNWAAAVTSRFTVAVWVGNFDGRPMAGVSGITGAGPLLHRAVLEVAKRYPPGAFATPAQEGAVAVEICRVSGKRAGAHCPRATEWFAPETVSADTCDWHEGGVLRLPAPYAEWLAQGGAGAGTLPMAADRLRSAGATAVASQSGGAPRRPDSTRPAFHIVSPLDGDRYAVPPSVDPRYATIPLRVA